MRSLENIEKWTVLSSLLIILVYFVPVFIEGEDIPLTIHDNMDSTLTAVKILLDEQGILSPPWKVFPQIMNGVDRGALYESYNICFLWFKLFGIFWGYIANKLIMSLVAFWGMFLLSKKLISPSNSNIILSGVVAVLFALLPFWSFSLSIAGIPMLLYAFYTFYTNQQTFFHWVYLVLFPFYSSLVLSGLFIGFFIFSILLFNWIKQKKIQRQTLVAFFLFSLLYIPSHFPIFYKFIWVHDYVSHRQEFLFNSASLSAALNQANTFFRLGQYHTHSIHFIFIVPVFLAFSLKLIQNRLNIGFIFPLLSISFITLIYGFINWEPLSPFVQNIMSVIPIQLQRFHALFPAFWYILVLFTFDTFLTKWKVSGIGVAILVCIQFNILWTRSEFRTTSKTIPFDQFYSSQLLHEIDTFIGKPKETYRVVSLGLDPSIALFNGFYCLDGYLPDYPLKHKHQFRAIISEELDKDQGLKQYFDNWGSRCYVYSAEIRHNYYTNTLPDLEALNLNIDALRKMNCQYILSRSKINSPQKGLKLEKSFDSAEYYWTIHLYRVLPT